MPFALQNRVLKIVKVLLRLPGFMVHACGVARRLGVSAAWGVFRASVSFWSSRPGSERGKRPLRLAVRGYQFPITLRTRTSDLFVFEQVVYREEYAPLKGLGQPRFILDCGANVGYTSVYLLSLYPTARLIAVEPEPGNAAVCRENLAPFAGRAEVVEAGVWPRTADLRVEQGKFRDGREWSNQVRECRPGEACHVKAISITDLMARAKTDRIDILKIDIEGAEKYLFAAGCEVWLSKVDVLAIETHDEESHAIVLRAVGEQGFASVNRVGETLYCMRRARLAHLGAEGTT